MSALGSSRLLNLPGGDIGGHNLTWTGTLTTILTAVTIAWTLYLLSLAIYRIYFHPLAKYPGPLLGKLTAWNAFWPAVRGQATLARHSWTQKYGRVVRIAPNELLFGDNQTVKDIYGQMSNACPKDAEFYGPFTVTGARNVFNSYDRIEHAAIRRLLSHAFSMNEIKKTQIRIIPIIERCLKIIEHSPQPVNFWEKFSYMFLDIVSDLSFDRCFNCLEGEMLKEAHDADAVQNISAIRGWVPFIVYVPSSFVQEAVRARPRLIKFARQQIDEFRARSAAGTVQEGSLLKRVVEAEDEETGRKMSDLELMENAIVFLQAGSETSLSALCYLLYEVDRRPAIKDRLVQEIREAFPDTHVFPDFDTADKLPFLNNVVDEILRLRGPIPVSLPRVSPGKYIGGEYVPAGVKVSIAAYTTHRDPAVYPDPDRFEPDRWANATPEMRECLRPFSSGPRNCIGLHLARLQLFLTITALYQRYDIKLDPSVTEEMMAPYDRGILSPTSQKVLFHVTPRAA